MSFTELEELQLYRCYWQRARIVCELYDLQQGQRIYLNLCSGDPATALAFTITTITAFCEAEICHGRSCTLYRKGISNFDSRNDT